MDSVAKLAIGSTQQLLKSNEVTIVVALLDQVSVIGRINLTKEIK
jgi:hypothetical protein